MKALPTVPKIPIVIKNQPPVQCDQIGLFLKGIFTNVLTKLFKYLFSFGDI